MATPWSHTAEAFLLQQMGIVALFWKQGRQAEFDFKVRNGAGVLSLSYWLPDAGSPIPPNPHPAQSHSKPHPRPPIPLFPNGEYRDTRTHTRSQVSSHRVHSQSHNRSRPPSYSRRNYRRAVLHRAGRNVANLPMPKPNSLRELATRALPTKSAPLSVNRKRPRSPSPDLLLEDKEIQSSSPTNC